LRPDTEEVAEPVVVAAAESGAAAGAVRFGAAVVLAGARFGAALAATQALAFADR
jgi:hypothetical protein